MSNNQTKNDQPASCGERATQLAQHTPGPWKVGQWKFETDIDCEKFITTDDEQPMAIASVYFDIDKGEANARLLAAAPELLEALKSIEVWLTAPDLCASTIQDMQAYARAAIAKSSGN